MSKAPEYKKALQEIVSLCLMHVGDKQSLAHEVKKVARDALKRKSKSEKGEQT